MVDDQAKQARGLLLQFMYAELEAARSLYMDNLLEQSAFHILRGWRALARLDVLRSGGDGDGDGTVADEDPGELSLETLPVAELVGKDTTGWEESLAAVQGLANGGSDLCRPAAAAMDRGALRLLRKQLELQLHLSDQAYQQAFWKERAATSRLPMLPRPRSLGAVALVLVIAVGAWLYLSQASDVDGEEASAGGAANQGADKSRAAVPPDDRITEPPPPRTTKNHEVTLAQVSEVKEAGTYWNAEGCLVFKEWIKVKLPAVSRAAMVELSVDNNDVYELSFRKGKDEVGLARLEPNKRLPGLRVATVQAPKSAQEDGYDQVWLKALYGDSFYSLGHLVLKGGAKADTKATPDAGTGTDAGMGTK
jgi:hypothetical protein